MYQKVTMCITRASNKCIQMYNRNIKMNIKFTCSICNFCRRFHGDDDDVLWEEGEMQDRYDVRVLWWYKLGGVHSVFLSIVHCCFILFAFCIELIFPRKSTTCNKKKRIECVCKQHVAWSAITHACNITINGNLYTVNFRDPALFFVVFELMLVTLVCCHLFILPQCHITCLRGRMNGPYKIKCICKRTQPLRLLNNHNIKK